MRHFRRLRRVRITSQRRARREARQPRHLDSATPLDAHRHPELFRERLLVQGQKGDPAATNPVVQSRGIFRSRLTGEQQPADLAAGRSARAFDRVAEFFEQKKGCARTTAGGIVAGSVIDLLGLAAEDHAEECEQQRSNGRHRPPESGGGIGRRIAGSEVGVNRHDALHRGQESFVNREARFKLRSFTGPLPVPMVVERIDHHAERGPRRRAIPEQYEVLAIRVRFVQAHAALFVEAVDEREKEEAHRLGVISRVGTPIGLLTIAHREQNPLGVPRVCMAADATGRHGAPHRVHDVVDDGTEQHEAGNQNQPEQPTCRVVKRVQPVEEIAQRPLEPVVAAERAKI